MTYYEILDLASIGGEVWLRCPGFENHYLVSNLGRIKSLTRTVRFGKKHSHLVTFHEKIISQYKNKAGYLVVGLYDGDKCKNTKVHRVIAKAFIENPQNKPIPNHINGIKHDNRVDNLEWATHSENRKHAIGAGLIKFRTGSSHPQSKKVYQYNLRGELIKTYESIGLAVRGTGYSQSHIGKNCQGKYRFYGENVWSYVELGSEYFVEPFKTSKRKEKIVIQYDLSDNEISRYFNPLEAAEKNNMNASNIHYCAAGKSHTCGGFKWRYAKDV